MGGCRFGIPAESGPHPRKSGCRFARGRSPKPRRGDPFRGFGGFSIYQKRRHPCGCRRFCMPAGREPHPRESGCRFVRASGHRPRRFAEAPEGKRQLSEARPLPCHPEIVVTRLCCQHFAEWQKCTTCKAVPPLPKNLASLRFSGALVLSRAVERVLRAVYQLQTLFLCSEHLLRSVQDLSARFARSG